MRASADDGVMLVGVLSDTHGRLPAGLADAFRDVEMILHAGDIGSAMVLAGLEEIAPTTAVRGNMDWGTWAERLPEIELLTCGRVRVGLVHDVQRWPPAIRRQGCRVIVAGHTHRPRVEERDGVLFLNPGSAGQPRFGQPPTVALLRIEGGRASARILRLVEDAT